jgi:hypothetical protein
MLIKWIILDNVKYRKVTLGHLAKVFNIANAQAVAAIPSSHNTLVTWIHNIYWHFEPRIITEIRTANRGLMCLLMDGGPNTKRSVFWVL